MKKLLAIVLTAIMLILTGCPGNEKPKSNDNKTQVKKSNKEAAMEFMDNYMRYMLRGDATALKSFYSPEIRDQMENAPTAANPHPVGYKLETGQEGGGQSEGEGQGSSGEEGGGDQNGQGKSQGKNMQKFTAHIFNASTASTYFSDDTYKYTIITDNGRMLIDKIEKGKTKEIFSKGNTLYSREGDKADGESVISLDDMPLYTTSRQLGEQKFPVPKNSFGPCALSPDGKSTIISTKGPNIFIAMVRKEESEQTVKFQGGGQSDDKQGGGGGQDQGQGKGGQQGQEGQEKKPKITIKPVDLYFNSSINVITFSPDGKTMAVEYIPASKLHRIALYTGENAEPAETGMDKSFRPDRFSIKNPYFVSKDEMVFTVVPGKDTTPEEQMLKGEWVLNVKSSKMKQIK